MNPQEKEKIISYLNLYPLTQKQKTAAEGFILPAALFLKTYLHRLDLPKPLYPICAQLAIAQAVAAGIMLSMDTTETETDTKKEPGIKSITQGDTTVTFSTQSDEHKETVVSASNMKIALSPAQVIEQNREVLNQFKRGLLIP